MRRRHDYRNIFNNIDFCSPKSIRGDSYEVKDIKIHENYLYNQKNHIKNHQEKVNRQKTFNKTNIEDKKEETKNQQQEIKQKFKYCIHTSPDNLIYIPNNEDFYTNDKDLKQLIDLMNEPATKELGYSNVINEKNCQVYKRFVEGVPVILIKSIAKLPYSKDVVFEAISNLNIRKQWDSVFSELKVVNHEGENGAEILYMIIKSPVFVVDDRDFVQQRKIWKNFPTEKSHILHFISIDTPACPVNKKYVRAETVISGYYMQDDPDEPSHCIIGIISQTDIKGKIPVFLVNKFAPKSSKSWIKSLHKGCKIVMENNNFH